MKLDFTILSNVPSISGGQTGTSGTISNPSLLGSESRGDSLGSHGDKLLHCPPKSPVGPHSKKVLNCRSLELSHLSPSVPALSDEVEERAAIMEFEGGLTRTVAENLTAILQRFGLDKFY